VCGRYTLAAPNPAQIRERFPVGESIEIRRRFNVAPGDDVLAVTTDREGAPRGELLRWGLVPFWAKSPDTALKMINARVETIAEKPAYSRAFERYRCLIVADGFYEWQRRPAGPKQAFHITRADGEPFAFAGLWSVWRPREEDGDPARLVGATPVEPIRSCTIITTAANDAIASLHDRMPVILARAAEAAWLDAATPSVVLHELLRGLSPAETELRPVGPAVNDARYDGPECLAAPIADAQSALF
jgi:putative SOS response-associated peptidase YedK